jgi:hypothetical protein
MKRFSIALVLMVLSVTACSGPAALGAQATQESANRDGCRCGPTTGDRVSSLTRWPMAGSSRGLRVRPGWRDG